MTSTKMCLPSQGDMLHVFIIFIHKGYKLSSDKNMLHQVHNINTFRHQKYHKPLIL